MPHIVVYCPVLGLERKRACAAALTRAFVESTGIEAEHLVIHIEEHSFENVAVAGKLLSDQFPELMDRERARRAEP